MFPNVSHSFFLFLHISPSSIVIIPGKSCCPLKKNISSTTSTPQPWTTQTLMPGLKLMAHARVKMGPPSIARRIMFLFSLCELESHFSLQADGDAGGTVQHWQDHLHPLSPRTGISFEKLPSNETFVTSLYSGLPWHQNRTRTNYRQVVPFESLFLVEVVRICNCTL